VDALCGNCLVAQKAYNKPLKKATRGFGRTFHYAGMFLWRYLLTVGLLVPLMALFIAIASPVLILGGVAALGWVWWKPGRAVVKGLAKGLYRARTGMAARGQKRTAKRIHDARLAAFQVEGQGVDGPGLPEMEAHGAPQMSDTGISSEEVTGKFPVGNSIFTAFEGLPSRAAPGGTAPAPTEMAGAFGLDDVLASVPGMDKSSATKQAAFGSFSPMPPASMPPTGPPALPAAATVPLAAAVLAGVDEANRVVSQAARTVVRLPKVTRDAVRARVMPPPTPAEQAEIQTFQDTGGAQFAMWASPRESQPNLADRDVDAQRYARAYQASQSLWASGAMPPGSAPRFFEYRRYPENVVEVTINQGANGPEIRESRVTAREAHVLLREARTSRRQERRGHDRVEVSGGAGLGLS
jgi:hypothetical protein